MLHWWRTPNWNCYQPSICVMSFYYPTPPINGQHHQETNLCLFELVLRCSWNRISVTYRTSRHVSSHTSFGCLECLVQRGDPFLDCDSQHAHRVLRKGPQSSQLEVDRFISFTERPPCPQVRCRHVQQRKRCAGSQSLEVCEFVVAQFAIDVIFVDGQPLKVRRSWICSQDGKVSWWTAGSCRKTEMRWRSCTLPLVTQADSRKGNGFIPESEISKSPLTHWRIYSHHSQPLPNYDYHSATKWYSVSRAEGLAQ